jgi:CDP-glucose 4,6-dehydratase
VAVASARAGNVIGGGDWAADRLVPDVLSAFAQGRTARIRNPNAIRPWQHVLEPLSGYLVLCEHLYSKPLDFAGAWNFGPGEEDAQSVRWVVEQLAATWGAGAAWQVDTREQPHEAHYLKLDISKAYANLNWRPQWALGQALAQTVQWYRYHSEGGDMRSLTLEQIAAYRFPIAAAPR